MNFRIDHKRQAAVDPNYRQRLLHAMQENNAHRISNELYRDVMRTIEYDCYPRPDSSALLSAYCNWPV